MTEDEFVAGPPMCLCVWSDGLMTVVICAESQLKDQRIGGHSWGKEDHGTPSPGYVGSCCAGSEPPWDS